jgi:hypothetical protein
MCVCFIVFSEKGYLCVPLLLFVLTEVVENYVPENQDNQSSIILTVVTNVFQKILEVMARCLRKDPEEGQEVRRMAYVPNALMVRVSIKSTHVDHLEVVSSVTL